ncbi:putative MFS multidrug transporter [Whalleya microplaca]|nr:putative MFS multidrug transporter [Whalleya microplaca]
MKKWRSHHDALVDLPSETDLVDIVRNTSNQTSHFVAENQFNAHVDALEQSDVANATDTEFKPNYGFYLAFSSLTILAMMVSLDGTSVSVALPIMAQDLKGNTTEVFWTGTSYLLTSTVFLLPLGALSHIFGRVPIIIFCDVCFLVGIIISSVAKNYVVMLLGRSIQGVGGGGIFLLNEVVMTDLVPLRLRGIYTGIIGGVAALGSVAGPVIGGTLAYKANWRWIFWILIPFAAASLIIVPLFLRLRPTPGSMNRKFLRVDWFGNIIMISATTSFIMPITWGGTQYPWSSWQTLVPLLLGVAGMTVFCWYEVRVAAEPTIRMSLLRSYNMAYSVFAVFVSTVVVYGALYFLPLYYEVVKSYDPILSGVALFPATFTIAPVSIISGFVIARTGDFRVVTWMGWLATTLGCGIGYLLDVDTTVVEWVFMTLIPGIGLGFLYTSLALINQEASSEGSMAFAVSLFVFFRSLGQCFGVAISGAAFQNQIGQRLKAIPQVADRAAELSVDTAALVQLIESAPEGEEQRALVQIYADSLKMVWVAMCALSGLALVGSVWIRRASLNRPHQTGQNLIDSKR